MIGGSGRVPDGRKRVCRRRGKFCGKALTVWWLKKRQEKMQKKLKADEYRPEYAGKLVAWFKNAPLYIRETRTVYSRKNDKSEEVSEKVPGAVSDVCPVCRRDRRGDRVAGKMAGKTSGICRGLSEGCFVSGRMADERGRSRILQFIHVDYGFEGQPRLG